MTVALLVVALVCMFAITGYAIYRLHYVSRHGLVLVSQDGFIE